MISRSWFEKVVIKLMGMEVNSMTYLLVVLSIVHSIIVIVVGAINDFVLFGTTLVNYSIGFLGAALAAWLVKLLIKHRWRVASAVSQFLSYLWTVLSFLLIVEGEWKWLSMSVAYILVFAYLSLGSAMHHRTGYPLNKPREYYGKN